MFAETEIWERPIVYRGKTYSMPKCENIDIKNFIIVAFQVAILITVFH